MGFGAVRERIWLITAGMGPELAGGGLVGGLLGSDGI